MTHAMEPIEGPVLDAPLDEDPIEVPDLARHEVELTDGHTVGVTVAGEGIPLVVVHGFSAEGFLYAQSLSRLVDMGFRVIAIDTAGHGATQGLPLSGHDINDYAELLGRAIDELGIEMFVLAGHSMGGQLISRLAARRPERTLAVIFIDAIVGDTWDRMVYLFRFSPALLAGIGVLLVADSLTVIPAFSDPRQAAKLMRLVGPTVAGHVMRPWRLLGPMASILRTRSSRYSLDELARFEVPVVAIHGSNDLAVPFWTAQDTVRRTRGTLVTVQGGGHSWILRDPETLPKIMSELLDGGLREAIFGRLASAGVEGEDSGVEEIEAACYRPGAGVLTLTPEPRIRKVRGRHRRPRYRWTIQHSDPLAGPAVA